MGVSVAPRSRASHVPDQTERRRRYKSPSLLTAPHIISNFSGGGYQDRRLGATMASTSAATTAGSREDRIRQALEQVSSGVSVPAAAKHFDIPPSTLYRHRKGGIKRRGGQTVFSAEQEKVFVLHLMTLSDFLIPWAPKELCKYIQYFLDSRGLKEPRFSRNRPGRDWAAGFMKRHDDVLKKRTVVPIIPRKGCMDADDLKLFFDRLRPQLTDPELKPEWILNFDETNLVNNPGSSVAIVRRSEKQKAALMVKHGKEGWSVMFAGTASGRMLPPYVVFKSAAKIPTVNPKWTEPLPPPLCYYDASSSGWFKKAQFERWFKAVVLPWAEEDPSAKKLIIGDNLSSHFSDPVMDLCLAKGISFKAFPANSTHLLQPLDVACFGPIKRQWRQVLSDWRGQTKGGGSLNKVEFVKRVAELLPLINCSNLTSGFKASGIWPFNFEEARKRLPAKQQGVLDQSGSDLVQFLKDKMSDEKPGPSQLTKKRPPPGTDLQNRDVNACLEFMLQRVEMMEQPAPPTPAKRKRGRPRKTTAAKPKPKPATRSKKAQARKRDSRGCFVKLTRCDM